MAFLQRLSLLCVLAAAAVSYHRKRISELPRASALNPETGRYENRADSAASTIEIVERAADTQGARMTLVEKCLAGSPERFYPDKPCSPPDHIHTRQDETFWVLQGTMSYNVDGTEGTLKAGETVTVPKGAAHHFWNAHDEDLAFKVSLEPALTADVFFENLWGLAKEEYTSPLQMVLLFYSHDLDMGQDVPPPVKLLMQYVLAPLAQLLGFRSYYPQYTSQRSLEGMNGSP